jgi:hypothetical protein
MQRNSSAHHDRHTAEWFSKITCCVGSLRRRALGGEKIP